MLNGRFCVRLLDSNWLEKSNRRFSPNACDQLNALRIDTLDAPPALLATCTSVLMLPCAISACCNSRYGETACIGRATTRTRVLTCFLFTVASTTVSPQLKPAN